MGRRAREARRTSGAKPSENGERVGGAGCTVVQRAECALRVFIGELGENHVSLHDCHADGGLFDFAGG